MAYLQLRIVHIATQYRMSSRPTEFPMCPTFLPQVQNSPFLPGRRHFQPKVVPPINLTRNCCHEVAKQCRLNSWKAAGQWVSTEKSRRWHGHSPSRHAEELPGSRVQPAVRVSHTMVCRGPDNLCEEDRTAWRDPMLLQHPALQHNRRLRDSRRVDLGRRQDCGRTINGNCKPIMAVGTDRYNPKMKWCETITGQAVLLELVLTRRRSHVDPVEPVHPPATTAVRRFVTRER